MKNKTDYLEKILNLEAYASTLMAEASRLRKEVVDKFCPYEVGQFIRIKRKTQDETVKIVIIKYKPAEPCTIDKQWEIRVEPWLADLSRPVKNRGSFRLMPRMDFELINENQMEIDQ